MVESHNESEATRKQFATLQARTALAGWVLEQAQDGGGAPYLVTRWGRARTCSTLAEVEQLLDEVAPEVWPRAGGGG